MFDIKKVMQTVRGDIDRDIRRRWVNVQLANPDVWRRKFAWFPVQIGPYWVWLEPYEERLGAGGWGVEVRMV